MHLAEGLHKWPTWNLHDKWLQEVKDTLVVMRIGITFQDGGGDKVTTNQIPMIASPVFIRHLICLVVTDHVDQSKVWLQQQSYAVQGRKRTAPTMWDSSLT